MSFSKWLKPSANMINRADTSLYMPLSFASTHVTSRLNCCTAFSHDSFSIMRSGDFHMVLNVSVFATSSFAERETKTIGESESCAW